MKLHPLLIHLSVATSVVMGVLGMGIIYNAVTARSLYELSLGWPLLLVGLWWSGRYLAISRATRRPGAETREAGSSVRASDGTRQNIGR